MGPQAAPLPTPARLATRSIAGRHAIGNVVRYRMRRMRPTAPGDLDAIPRLGWVRDATPITALPELAAESGLAWLGVKRDDLLEPLHGGSKPRKLDYLLASPPFKDAPAWAAAGAIGSGNLVALTAAAEELERRHEAHVFWTNVSAGTLDNLAFVASGPTSIAFYGSSTSMALRHPSLVLGDRLGGVPIVPPGSTSPLGIVGLVRAGLELAEQIRAGELPEPDRIYLAFGSGGTAVGLALGLGLAGLATEIVAVRVVARAFAGQGRTRGLLGATSRELAKWQLEVPASPPKLRIDQRHAGAGYAVVTPEALSACVRLAEHGIRLEPVYTGKAMAALFADAARGQVKRALFWQTARREPLEHAPDWREKLPPALARRLGAHELDPTGRRASRRRVIVGVAAALGAVALGVRLTGYASIEGLSVLASWEADVLGAAAEALLPPRLDAATRADVAVRVDRYLVGMPPNVHRDVHSMLALIEHGTTPLGLRLHRFTALPVAEREAYLAGLAARGGLLAQAYDALRQLCMLGYYQRSVTWVAIGYEGPRVPLDYDPHGPARMVFPDYERLRAPDGALPAAVIR